MNQYDTDALMAYFKKHQISRRTAVIGGTVVVVAGATGAYLALQPGGQPEQTTPTTPTTPTAPSTPSTPSAPSRPSAPAPEPTPAPAPEPSPAPQESRKLVIALFEDMPTLFPLAYPPGGSGPHRTIANFQEMLVYENRDYLSWGEASDVGILAPSNGVGPAPGSAPGDLSRVRIKLRPNVRFHSGAKLTSESLSGPFDFQHVYDDSNWSFYYPTRPGGMTTEIVDDLTADMVFPRTNLSNLTGFTHSGRPFLWNPAWVEEKGLGGRGGNLGGEDQDGTGPFKMKEWIPGTRIVMERNRDYWADNLPDDEKQSLWGGAGGNLDEIVFVFIKEPSAQITALESGDIDVIVETDMNSVGRLQRNPNVSVFESGPSQVHLVYFNTLYKPLQDLRVRQAIYNVIDSRGLRALFDDRNPVARGLFLPWMLGFTDGIKGWRPVDVGKAKELMSESGYKDGFDLEVSPDSRPENRLVGTALGPMIEKTGINAKVKVYQNTEWSALTSDNEQTTLQLYPFTIGFRRESIDLFDFFFRAKFRRIRSSMEVPFLHGDWFPGKPGRPDFGLLGQIAREPSEARRASLYQQAASYVVDNALLSIPLYTARTASYSKKVLNWNDVKFGPMWRGNGNYNPYRTKVA